MEWNEQKRRLNAELTAGESLLWSGEPRRGILLRPSDALLIPSTLVGVGFALFWNYMVWTSNGSPVFFRAVGALVFLQALYFLIGRFFVDAWQRSKTYYGVTNERVIVLSGILSTHVKSLSLRTMNDISINERRDLSGTITFGPVDDVSDWRSKLPFKTGSSDRPTYPILDSIENAKRVYEIIRNAQRAAV